ncbi:Ubiquitin-related modifier like protein [Plasmodiophora brassicae]
MRLSASGRQVVAALGFCIGVAIGLIASWFLLPSYVQFLLYVASIVNPHNPVHVTLLLVSLIVSATPVGFGSTFLMVITAIRFRWWAFPIVYVCYLIAGAITFHTVKAMVRRQWVTLEWLKSRVPRYANQIAAVENTVVSNGIVTTSLLQLSACPYGVSCAVLPLTEITFLRFLLGCGISRLHLCLWIYIGITTADIGALFLRMRSGDMFTNMELHTIISLVSFVITFILILFLHIFSKRYLDRLAERQRPAERHLHEDAPAPSSNFVIYQVEYGQRGSIDTRLPSEQIALPAEVIHVSPSYEGPQ